MIPSVANLMSPYFPSSITDTHEAAYTTTAGDHYVMTLAAAESMSVAVKHGVKVIAAIDYDADINAYRAYIGVDKAGDICYTTISHGKSTWHGLSNDAQRDVELVYDMVHGWAWAEDHDSAPISYEDMIEYGIIQYAEAAMHKLLAESELAR